MPTNTLRVRLLSTGAALVLLAASAAVALAETPGPGDLANQPPAAQQSPDVPTPGVRDPFGVFEYSCAVEITNKTSDATLVDMISSKWDTDRWTVDPDGGDVHQGDSSNWESTGQLFRGCGNSIGFNLISTNNSEKRGVNIDVTSPFKGNGSPTRSCVIGDAKYSCELDPDHNSSDLDGNPVQFDTWYAITNK